MLVWGEQGIWSAAERGCWPPAFALGEGGGTMEGAALPRSRPSLPTGVPTSRCPADLQRSESLQGRLGAWHFPSARWGDLLS